MCPGLGETKPLPLGAPRLDLGVIISKRKMFSRVI